MIQGGKQNGYLKALRTDIDRWIAKGLLGENLGDDLLTEAVDYHQLHMRHNPVLPGFASLAILLGILTIIGANWAGMTGIVRLGLTFGLFGLTLFLAGDLRARGVGVWSDFAAMIAATLFGGGLVVIGQHYHSQETTAGFLAVWALGATLISLLVASPRAGMLAAVLGIAWTLYHYSENYSSTQFNIGPIALFPMWAALIWRAYASRALGIVHIVFIGIVVWIAPPLVDLIELFVTDEFKRQMAFVFFWIGIAACVEIIARAIPFWASRTLAGWCVWVASTAFVSLTALDRFETHFAPITLPIIGLVGFSALTAYGAAPGRRWLRGAGIAGFIAIAVIIFTLIDDMILAGLTLIIFGVLLTGLILITNGILGRAMRRQSNMRNLDGVQL